MYNRQSQERANVARSFYYNDTYDDSDDASNYEVMITNLDEMPKYRNPEYIP